MLQNEVITFYPQEGLASRGRRLRLVAIRLHKTNAVTVGNAYTKLYAK